MCFVTKEHVGTCPPGDDCLFRTFERNILVYRPVTGTGNHKNEQPKKNLETC